MSSVQESDQQGHSTVERTLSILELVVGRKDGISLAELAKELAFPKSTIHRLIDILTSREYVELNMQTQKYSAGLKSIEIGVSALRSMEIVDVSSAYMRDLARQSGETSFLAVLNEGEIVYLHKAEGSQSIRTTAQLGMRRPVHCTAVGKALLSALSTEEVERILADKGMAAYTANTITDAQSMLAELRQIRIDGCAVDREEIEIGLTCFAAPVFQFMGQIAGAISLAGPTIRVKEKQDEYMRLVNEAARQISRRMGYVPAMRSNL